MISAGCDRTSVKNLMAITGTNVSVIIVNLSHQCVCDCAYSIKRRVTDMDSASSLQGDWNSTKDCCGLGYSAGC